MKGLPRLIISLCVGFLCWSSAFSQTQYKFPFLNPALPIDKRVDDLLSRMTLEEKVSQVDGDEVVQLYVHRPGGGEYEAIKSLKGFARVHIPTGTSTVIRIPLAIHDLHEYDDQTKDEVVAPGEYELQVGSSSSDIRLTTWIQVEP